ncbi:hypothetical protein [Actinoplanes sp. NPDC051411]|uniref:hypothetical protein n=1 Tax=Actinoplanes sp. NPDC051411 TaxID=3155522 RepID=UPI003439DE7A
MLAAADVLFDPAAAYPQVGELRATLARRDWAATRSVIESAPADARCLLVREGSDLPGLEDLLLRVLADDPDDALAAALLGTHLIEVGWRIRTRARARHVSREQFVAFRAWLTRAEHVLLEATARHPEEPAVWVARITSSRGLELGPAEGRRRYDRLRASDPHNYLGQSQFLQLMCPKWAGTWEKLHAWAREEMLASPPGSLAGALVAEAHLEHSIDMAYVQRQAYFGPARDELHYAAHHSIWNPDFRRPAGWVHAASAFAMAFSQAGDEQAAARTFSLLGSLASVRPWEYLGADVAAVVRDRRRRAHAAAGGPR